MQIKQLLQAKNPETELLLEYALKKPKEFLYINPGYELSPYELERFRSALAKRKQGVPVAYILGYKYFQGFKFKVNKNVLIPRPETETLVERALNIVKGQRSKVKSILDLGTGSGCIAISLCKLLQAENLSKYSILASDISLKALTVAKSNAEKLQAPVKFVQSNLFSNIAGKFDIVLANLPYVPKGLYQILHNNLKFEPKIAITDNTDSWEIYGRFFQTFGKHLKPKGVALLEIDDCAKNDLTKLFNTLCPKPNSYQLKFTKDLSGRIRFLTISRK